MQDVLTVVRAHLHSGFQLAELLAASAATTCHIRGAPTSPTSPTNLPVINAKVVLATVEEADSTHRYPAPFIRADFIFDSRLAVVTVFLKYSCHHNHVIAASLLDGAPSSAIDFY